MFGDSTGLREKEEGCHSADCFPGPGSSEQASCTMMPEVDQSKSYMIDPCNPNTKLMDVFNVSTDTIAKGVASLVVHCQNRIEWVAEQMVMLVNTRSKNGYGKHQKITKEMLIHRSWQNLQICQQEEL
jgi:hypothetical protein